MFNNHLFETQKRKFLGLWYYVLVPYLGLNETMTKPYSKTFCNLQIQMSM